MRVTTPQITWHGGENGKNDPVLSADVHPCGVLATGGADADIRVWLLHLDEEKDEKDFQDFLYNLEGHEKSVNAVRFSPNGRILASASDGGTIILHQLPDDRPLRTWCFASKAKKVMGVRFLRTTQDDVYDLCWSPSSTELVSASVDHKVFVWGVASGKCLTSFDDHHNYVQGVCWDPREKYLVSESNDRSVRVYARKAPKPTRKKSSGKKKDKAAAAAAAAAAATTDAKPADAKPTADVKPTSDKPEADKPEADKADGAEPMAVDAPEAAAPAVSAVSSTTPAVSTTGPSVAAPASTPVTTGPEPTSTEPAATSTATSTATATATATANANVLPPNPLSLGPVEFVLHCTLKMVAKQAPPPTADDGKPKSEEVIVIGEGEVPTSTEAKDAMDESEDVVVVSSTSAGPAPKVRGPNRPNLFADETVPTFFRRPSWSPDGCLLVTPTGLHKGEHDHKGQFVTHVFARDKFDKPVLQLPNGSKASVAVRFCPQLFALRESKHPTPSLTNLPYRMLYAVLTVNSILVYDTQHFYPLAIVRNTHLASLTDAAWLPDGRALVATSMDGYVTVLSFPDKELGEPLDLNLVPPTVRRLHRPIYEQKERDAEDEELDRLEAQERAEAAVLKAERAKIREAEEEERKIKERERKHALREQRRLEKEAAGKDGAAEEDDEVQVLVVRKAGSKGPAKAVKAAKQAAKPTAKPAEPTKPREVVTLDDDDEESLNSQDSQDSEDEEEDGLEAEEKPKAKAQKQEAGRSMRGRRTAVVELLELPEESEESEGSAHETDEGSDDEEEDEEEVVKVDKGEGKKRVKRTQEEDKEESEDDEEWETGETNAAAAQSSVRVKRSVAADDSDDEMSQDESPSRKRKSEEGKEPTGDEDAPLKRDAADAAKEVVAKKAKRIAPTLVQPLSGDSASPTAAPEQSQGASATAEASAPAAKPKKRLAPTLVSGPNAASGV